MDLNTFLENVKSKQAINFDDTMAIINAHYQYTPTSFTNGLGESGIINKAGTNEGSCKIFAFAQLNQLDQDQTLSLFGDFYHQDVLQDPSGTSHQNIRNFMQSSWGGIKFNATNTLVPK